MKRLIRNKYVSHTSLLFFFSALASNFARFLAPNFGSIAAVTLGSTSWSESSLTAFSFLGSRSIKNKVINYSILNNTTLISDIISVES